MNINKLIGLEKEVLIRNFNSRKKIDQWIQSNVSLNHQKSKGGLFSSFPTNKNYTGISNSENEYFIQETKSIVPNPTTNTTCKIKYDETSKSLTIQSFLTRAKFSLSGLVILSFFFVLMPLIMLASKIFNATPWEVIEGHVYFILFFGSFVGLIFLRYWISVHLMLKRIRKAFEDK